VSPELVIEKLLALALMQQSFEHLAFSERRLFLPRILLVILLFLGLWTKWVLLVLFIHAIFVLRRFAGPYNGGSDRMSLLVLACLCLAAWLPAYKIYFLAYLALQLVLSYFVAGVYKLLNSDWRSGRALVDLFSFSVYSAHPQLAQHRRLLLLLSWLVIIFELAFPLLLLGRTTMLIGLGAAMIFHLANAYFFGLNRFVWAWLAAYPALWCW